MVIFHTYVGLPEGIYSGIKMVKYMARSAVRAWHLACTNAGWIASLGISCRPFLGPQHGAMFGPKHGDFPSNQFIFSTKTCTFSVKPGHLGHKVAVLHRNVWLGNSTNLAWRRSTRSKKRQRPKRQIRANHCDCIGWRTHVFSEASQGNPAEAGSEESFSGMVAEVWFSAPLMLVNGSYYNYSKH